MKHTLDVAWNGQMKFEADLDGHHLIVDAAPEGGGENAGPRPKKLLLLSLAACTGMDVVSLMQKMRVEVDDFRMTVEGDVTEEHPKHYESMHLIYQFKGKDLPLDKLNKIVEMSQERYCGVAATFKQGISVTWEIKVMES
jgi:putative redox protein